MKRLVLIGEGKGDKAGGYQFVKRLLTEKNCWDTFIFGEGDCLKSWDLPSLLKEDCEKWRRLIGHAMKRPAMGALLLLLDGDADERILKERFCAKDHAIKLADTAIELGAGTLFSVAVVFACREFESWLIAGIESLAGLQLFRGVAGVKRGTQAPAVNLETTLRGAKEWLGRNMVQGYSPVRDQSELARHVEFGLIRQRGMRSFRRLEHAIDELTAACRTGLHCVSPRRTASTQIAPQEGAKVL